MLELELLQVALGSRKELSRTPSPQEWDAIYRFAEEQAIVGVMFGGIERLPKHQVPYLDLLMEWLGLSEYQKTQQNIFYRTVAEFTELMNENQITFVLFKGLAVASKYPSPSLRTMGDVDFYVPKQDFDRAVEVIEDNLCKITEKDFIDRHFAFEWKGVRFEMHYQMTTFGYRGHQLHFDSFIDYAISNDHTHFCIENCKVPMLPPLADMILVFKHWFGHFLESGIGLRQTTDIAVLIKEYSNDIDIDELKAQLYKLGCLRAFDSVVALIERYYFISWPKYWNKSVKNISITHEEADLYAKKIIIDVIKNGNFGRSGYKYTTGILKRLETTKRFFCHCIKYYNLAPKDIRYMMPQRIIISFKAHR